MIHWNEAHGVRLFRLSSNIFPWMTSFKLEDLPDWPQIQQVKDSIPSCFFKCMPGIAVGECMLGQHQSLHCWLSGCHDSAHESSVQHEGGP
jgi:hypothetical protein